MTRDESLDAALRAQLRHTLDATPWSTIGGRTLERYDGKVRDCYIDKERGERIIVVTDRLSAFDAVVGTIPSIVCSMYCRKFGPMNVLSVCSRGGVCGAKVKSPAFRPWLSTAVIWKPNRTASTLGSDNVTVTGTCWPGR